MTDDAEKGWLPKSYKKNDDVPLAAEEPVIEEVVEEVVAEPAPVAEEPAFLPVSKEAEAAQMLQDAIAKERAKVAERKPAFGDSPDKTIERAKRDEELQKKIDLMYTISMWGDYTKYECKECPFSTLDAQLIRTHVRKHM